MKILLASLLSAIVVGTNGRVCTWSDCGAPDCSELDGYTHMWSSGTCGNSLSSCSGGQKRLYCCQTPSPYSRIYWVTSCTDNCRGCGDDDCIINNLCGDGEKCVSGSRSLCGSKETPGTDSQSSFPWYFILLATLGAGGLCTIGAVSFFVTIFCCNGCDCCNCKDGCCLC